ncbi:MAG: methyltransferase [Candidatus Pacearchaeota archaeon]
MEYEIYQPAEDSYLMIKAMEIEIPKFINRFGILRLLEIGSGSGILLEAANSLGIKKENILGSDINKKAVECCRKLGFKCILSDLFESIPKQKFDFIIFNPPYLPLEEREPDVSKISTTGGKKGNELTLKFLKQCKRYLSDNGVILLITSSLSKRIDFKKLGFKTKKVLSQNLFFEEITVWKLKF